jgi:hypothetical protein
LWSRPIFAFAEAFEPVLYIAPPPLTAVLFVNVPDIDFIVAAKAPLYITPPDVLALLPVKEPSIKSIVPTLYTATPLPVAVLPVI